MSHLKESNVNKCFSLLRGYFEGVTPDGKSKTAILALDQLQRITAGNGTGDDGNENSGCNGRPRATENPSD